ITYVEDVDDPAQIWRILKDKYKPTTLVTRAQALKELQSLKMAEGGDMEVHLRDFQMAKRRVEEHGIKLGDDVYKNTLLLSVLDTYKVTVSIIESQPEITTEAAMNRLLEDHRKSTANESVMALLTKQQGANKAGKKGKSGKKANKNLKCNHCQKIGHVEAECWSKHPELQPKKRQASNKSTENESARVAFYATAPRTDVCKNSRGKGDPSYWILDSGASEHFSPFRQLFDTYERLDNPIVISTAEGEIYGVRKGAISITVVGDEDKAYDVILQEVIHAPDMDSNLISTTTLLRKGLEVSMHPTKGVNILMDGKIIAMTVPHGRLYR